jgi:hypothetical protein
MGWVEMSERELRRAEVLASVLAGGLTMTAAAGLMGITRRQAHHLARQFAEHGAAGLRHRPMDGPPIRDWGRMSARWPLPTSLRTTGTLDRPWRARLMPPFNRVQILLCPYLRPHAQQLQL